MLPDFLVIGAAKSATTWLIRCLGEHPQIWTHPDEIHFFSRHYQAGGGWYEKHFDAAPAGRLVGEKSNTYLPHEAAAERIRRLLPGCKLIAVLRDPVERAYSGYCMQLRAGRVSNDLAAHLDPDRPRPPGELDFLGQGFYARHLRRYRSHFPAEQSKVVLYDDVRAAPETVLDELASFLGVPRTEPSAAVAEKVNARTGRRASPLVRGVLARAERSAIAGPALRALAGSRAGRLLRSVSARQRVDDPPLPEALRAKLYRHFAEDVAELEGLLGRDLGGWRGRGS